MKLGRTAHQHADDTTGTKKVISKGNHHKSLAAYSCSRRISWPEVFTHLQSEFHCFLTRKLLVIKTGSCWNDHLWRVYTSQYVQDTGSSVLDVSKTWLHCSLFSSTPCTPSTWLGHHTPKVLTTTVGEFTASDTGKDQHSITVEEARETSIKNPNQL